jgi:hypothetical protein
MFIIMSACHGLMPVSLHASRPAATPRMESEPLSDPKTDFREERKPGEEPRCCW